MSRVVNLSTHRQKSAKERAADPQQQLANEAPAQVDTALAHLRKASACLDFAQAGFAGDRDEAARVAAIRIGAERLIKATATAKRPPIRVGRRKLHVLPTPQSQETRG